jgi:hypothetical protein
MMTSTQPWDIRHIYTTADPRYDNLSSWSYLTKLKAKLQEHKRGGRIRGYWQDRPVGVSTDIGTELQKCKRGELVIVDLHCWPDHPALGVTCEDGTSLRAVAPAKWWNASVVFLTGCWGSTDLWGEALNEILTHPTTVVGNSNDDGSGWRDHTPIELISEVLQQVAGADANGAYDAVDGYLRSHPDLTTKSGWMVHKRG